MNAERARRLTIATRRPNGDDGNTYSCVSAAVALMWLGVVLNDLTLGHIASFTVEVER